MLETAQPNQIVKCPKMLEGLGAAYLVHGPRPPKVVFCTMWRDQCYHVFSQSAITEVYFKV